jgi:hypothetical protein
MKRTYFHGTSADNLESILKHGLQCNTNKIWSCSDDKIYLWDVEGVAKENEIEDEDNNYKIERTRQMAIESAQIACAAAKDCRCVVLRIELDDQEIMPDTSCENMEGSGAVCIDRDINISEIVGIEVSSDLSLVKAYFITLIVGRDYNNIEFTPLEQKIAEAFKKTEIYPEDIDGMMEWNTIKAASIKKRHKKLASAK